MENKGGKFVVVSEESASKTLESVPLPANLRSFISEPEGADSYPIVTYTWILAYKKYPNAAKAKAIEVAIEYALTDGQKQASALGYVPLPPNVITKVAAAADQISPEYKISVASGICLWDCSFDNGKVELRIVFSSSWRVCTGNFNVANYSANY